MSGDSMISLLPAVGGIPPLALALWLSLKKDMTDTRKFFIITMTCLGFYGLFETLGYLSGEDMAWLFLSLSRVVLLIGVYSFFALSAELYGETTAVRSGTLFLLFSSMLTMFFLIERVEPAPWGWRMVFLFPVLVIYILSLVILMVLGIHLLYLVYQEIKEANPMLSEAWPSSL